MGDESDFGRKNGVEGTRFVNCFQRCMLWLPQKGLKWERFGTPQGEKVDET